MTLRDIQILALSLPGQTPRESLVRIVCDDFPNNYAVWDRSHLWWTRRHMTRAEAQQWCKDHQLPDATRKENREEKT